MSQPPPGPQQQPYPQYAQQPQYAGGPVPPPVKKKSKAGWLVAGGVLLLLIVAGIAAGGGGGKPASNIAGTAPTTAPVAQPPAAQQPAAPAKIVLVYEVTGAGSANNISYIADGTASTEQVTNVKLPWTKTIELDKSRAFSSSLVAQAGDGTPEISAKITANGKVIKEGKSSGQYAVVTVAEPLFSLK
jgi:hypothetical protein